MASESQQLTKSRTEAVASNVSYKGQIFRGLASIHDSTLETQRYRSVKGIVPDGAEIVMPLLHGMGPISSHAGSMFATLNALTESKHKMQRSQSIAMRKQLRHYRIIGGEAIDLPGSHGVSIGPEVRDLVTATAWIASWFETIKSSKLLVPLARSASASLVLEAARRYEGLLQGIVLLSPMLPSDREHSNRDLLDRIAQGTVRLNQSAFDWMNDLCAQSMWDDRDDPFCGTPTLILTGARDTQVSDRVRVQLQQWHDALPHVRFVNVHEAGHDVLNLRDRKPALESYAVLYEFLNDVSSAAES